MSAQHHAVPLFLVGQIESVVLLAGRMLGRDIERREVVPVFFDVRALGHGEAHFAEDRHRLVDGLADRMNASQRLGPHRQGDVDGFRRQLGVQLGRRQTFLAGLDSLGHFAF